MVFHACTNREDHDLETVFLPAGHLHVAVGLEAETLLGEKQDSAPLQLLLLGEQLLATDGAESLTAWNWLSDYRSLQHTIHGTALQ